MPIITKDKLSVTPEQNAKLNSKPPLIEDPTKPYTTLNKLPFMLRDYRGAAIRAFKDKFLEQIHIAQDNEKKACAKTGMQPMMVGETYRIVVSLVDRCRDFYELEALARFVFDDNSVPTYEETRRRAAILKNACGINFNN